MSSDAIKSAVGTVAATNAASTNRIDPSLKKVAAQFEAVFIRQMLATARQTKLADDVLGSDGTDNFRELADARTAETLAARGQFGIARLIEQQFAAKVAGR